MDLPVHENEASVPAAARKRASVNKKRRLNIKKCVIHLGDLTNHNFLSGQLLYVYSNHRHLRHRRVPKSPRVISLQMMKGYVRTCRRSTTTASWKRWIQTTGTRWWWFLRWGAIYLTNSLFFATARQRWPRWSSSWYLCRDHMLERRTNWSLKWSSTLHHRQPVEGDKRQSAGDCESVTEMWR